MQTNILPLFACCAVFFAPCAAPAAPGDLDRSFGGTGKVITAIGTGNDFGESVAVKSEGKIVVAGASHNGSNYDFALARYNADGTLDTSFGNGGKVTTAIGTGRDSANTLAIQSDGKIVVAGLADNASAIPEFALVRYHPNGTLDTSFNGTGKVTTSVFGHQDVVKCVVVQSDGKILATGQTSTGAGYPFGIVRYNANGSLDTTFGGTGKVATDFGFSTISEAVTLQSDGKIVVAGRTFTAGSNDFALVRYNTNGSLDTSFGSSGKVTTSLTSDEDNAYSVVVQSDGKILVAGVAGDKNPGHADFALVRYNSNGTLDTAFNGTGKVTADIAGADDYGKAVAVQSDGRIVVAGYSNNSSRDFAVLRFNANGSLDTSFHGTGKVTTDLGSDEDSGLKAALQTDGRIVVAGYVKSGSNYQFATVRYLGGNPTPLEAWKLANLGSYAAPDLGDTDFDGLALLAEYALVLSPTASSAPPAVTRFVYAAGERLRMFFTRDPARNDVTLEVQSADSPAGPWTTVAASTLGGVTTGPGYVGGDDATPGLKTVEVRDTVDISPTTPSRYLRVKVTH